MSRVKNVSILSAPSVQNVHESRFDKLKIHVGLRRRKMWNQAANCLWKFNRRWLIARCCKGKHQLVEELMQLWHAKILNCLKWDHLLKMSKLEIKVSCCCCCLIGCRSCGCGCCCCWCCSCCCYSCCRLGNDPLNFWFYGVTTLESYFYAAPSGVVIPA